MLVDSNSDSNYSSADRARRHGEVRMLRAIKRKQKYQEPKKRKFLKRTAMDDEENLDEMGDDIRDVDFRLNHDSLKMEVCLFCS